MASALCILLSYHIQNGAHIQIDFHQNYLKLPYHQNFDSSEISLQNGGACNSTIATNFYNQTVTITGRNDCFMAHNFQTGINNLKYILTTATPNYQKLEEMYRVRNTTIRNSVTLSHRQEVGYQLLFPHDRRVNLKGATIPVVTYKSERVIGVVHPVTGLITGNRAAESILRDMQIILNFKITLRSFTDKEISLTNSNYFGAGVVKQLDNCLADLAIGYFNIRDERVIQASPLLPIMAEGIYAFFSQPDENIVRNIYMTPAQPKLIFAYLIVMFGIGLYCVALAIKTAKNADHGEKMSQVIIIFAALATQKSLGTLVIRNPIFFMGAVISVLFYALYSAKLLTALLTTVYPVVTIEDLIHYGFTFHSLPAANSVVFNDTKRKLTRRNLSFEETKATSMQAIFKQRHVLIDVDFNTINGFSWLIRDILKPPLSDREICAKLSSIQFLNSKVFLSSSFFVRKNSPLRGTFNRLLLRIREVGLLQKYMKYTNSESSSLGCRKMWVQLGYQDNLRLSDVSSAFLLLCPAMMVCLALFVVEKSLFQVLKMLHLNDS